MPPVDLTLDADRGVRTEPCPSCGDSYRCIVGFVLRDGAPYAVYYAALHGHDDPTETWIDVTFSEVGPDAPPDGGVRTTFACRLGGRGNDERIGAALVDSGLAHEGAASFGKRLTRDEALGHRQLEQFWAVVDLLLEADPDIHEHTHSALGERP